MPEEELTHQETFDESKQGLSIASMVLGILGLVLMCTYGIGVIPSFIGLILGCIANSRKEGTKGFTIAGIVTSIIGLVIGAIWLIFWVVLLIAAFVSAI